MHTITWASVTQVSLTMIVTETIHKQKTAAMFCRLWEVARHANEMTSRNPSIFAHLRFPVCSDIGYVVDLLLLAKVKLSCSVTGEYHMSHPTVLHCTSALNLVKCKCHFR
jgi:hypothetical protein